MTHIEKERTENKWAAQKFGIPVDEVIWYHSGICYSRIKVSSEQSAKIISEMMNGRCVNGGWYDGMPLGRITKDEFGFEVTC